MMMMVILSTTKWKGPREAGLILLGPYGANGQITMRLQNYRSWQVHETLNGVIHPAVSEICVPQSLDQIVFDKFLAYGKPIWVKWANDHDCAQLQA